MKETLNPTALKSRKLLEEALTELISEKPYSEINVTDLTKKAHLSRRTFYRLFDSIDEIFLFHLKNLWAAKLKASHGHIGKSYVEICTFTLKFWYDNKALTILMYKNDMSDILLGFLNDISNEINEIGRFDSLFASNSEAINYASLNNPGSLHNIIWQWAANDCDKTPEELINMFKENLQPNKYIPMYLINSSFALGKVSQRINAISNTEIKEMALAEYYYFTGDHIKAEKITAKYLNSSDANVRMSASFINAFCNLTLCNIEQTLSLIDQIRAFLSGIKKKNIPIEQKALLVFIANAGNILLNLQITNLPPLKDYLYLLPKGLRIFGCYILSHKAYLEGEYEKGIGIVEACLALEGSANFIPVIYLYLAGAMNAMGADNVELGKDYFEKAYNIALYDKLYEPFGEHHGLLGGLIESCLRNEDKDIYFTILDITNKFSYGWRRVHNPLTKENVADTLSTMEFTIAMLANRGWSNEEIADFLDLKTNTVKSHISTIFTKLNITSRKELKDYMLK